MLVLVAAGLVGIAGMMGGCATQPQRLRVMTYNIRHGEGMDGRVDLERVARVIIAADPDLVALQEIDRQASRTGGVDQAVRLGELTGMHSGFAKFMDFGGGEYGLAILSKSPIDEMRRLQLPPGKREPRAVLAVRTTPTGWASPVVFVSLHFDWLDDDAERFAQAQSLLEQLGDEDGLVVLAGDFNDTPESRTMQLVFGSFANADKPAEDRLTFSSTEPDREIDFIVYQPADRVTGTAHVIDEPMASDHRPVVADFTYEVDSPR
jgi:endonuclease/exonuclease/phosphatase family metal-dependent hydrolase